MMEELQQGLARLIDLLPGTEEIAWDGVVWAVEWLTGLSLAVLAGWIALTVGAYLLPSLIALFRRHASRGWLFLFNLFFGWTTLGWFAALVWAVIGPSRPRPVPNSAFASPEAEIAEAGARIDGRLSVRPAPDRVSAGRG